MRKAAKQTEVRITENPKGSTSTSSVTWLLQEEILQIFLKLNTSKEAE
jgi:hypothetical protein